MNYEGLPEPAIELLFWYLPVDICLILHNKYKFSKGLWGFCSVSYYIYCFCII